MIKSSGKYLLFSLLVLFVLFCSYEKNHLIIKTATKTDTLSNVRLFYQDMVLEKRKPLYDGERIILGPDETFTLYIDLSETSSSDDICLVSAMKQGAKVSLKIYDSDLKKILEEKAVPMKGFEGFIKQDMVFTRYNSLGKKSGLKKSVPGKVTAYNEQEFTDTSVIPVDIQLSTGIYPDKDVYVVLEIDYSQYNQRTDDNTTVLSGAEIKKNLSDTDKEVVIFHKVDNKCIYGSSPRRTVPVRAVIARVRDSDKINLDVED